MTPKAILDYFSNLGYKVNIKFKNESGLMKFLNFFIRLFNKDFMTNYITAISNTIYVPNREWLEKNSIDKTSVIAHEMVHIIDRKRLSILYSFAYLFPQILAVLSFLSFLAFFNLNWLFCLLFLLFLAPIPAPGRAWAEIRGYSMSMYFKGTYSAKSKIPWEYEEYANWVTSVFCNSSYYFMFPFRKYVYDKLLTNYNLILGGLDKNLFGLYYDIYKFIESK